VCRRGVVAAATIEGVTSRPALRGTLLALASAVAFGVTTPLVQRFGRGAGSFATAALLYGGAALAGVATRSAREAKVARTHRARLVVVALFGALFAPALLAWGLARTSGIAASLMLNLEAVFTIALAGLVWREHVGRRVALAAGTLVLGGGLLLVDRAGALGSAAGPRTQALGLAAVAGAALAWAADNTLARPLAALDPASVVAQKGALGAALATATALALGERWPPVGDALALAVVGASGYGLSLRLYLKAQRALGAGRTASVFATAPFCGAALAWALGERAGGLGIAGGVAMLAGVALHVTERHEHAHTHEPLEHAHAHRHDDGHHDHAHEVMPEGEHTHAHVHGRIEHEHPHVPDLHHGHGHGHGHEEA
jgi:drug/metabolite transporter (DMT)-like permease